jgi:hypothetical protein
MKGFFYTPLLFICFLWPGCSSRQEAALKLPVKTGNELVDVFVADGDSLIIRPEHLGIVNGLATVGIGHDYVGVINGLWAQPYVSSDFFVEPRIFGERIKTAHYTWLPFQTKQTGQLNGITVTAVTTLIYGKRAGTLALTFKNTTGSAMEVPVQFIVNDPSTYQISLEYVADWEFLTPKSQRWATDVTDGKGIQRIQGDYAVAVGGDLPGLWWEAPTRRFHGVLSIPPGKETSASLVFSIGKTQDAVAARNVILEHPAQAVEEAEKVYQSKVAEIFSRLPEFHSDNKALEQLYTRSLSIFITNKAEAPELALHPHYGTGAVKGGCTCNYLWNYGQIKHILPLLDPEAHRKHILQFLRTDCVDKYYAFYPMSGEPFGAWYLVNHEKITGLTYDYIRLTGDAGILDEEVRDGKTVLDLMVECAVFGDDLSRPAALIDYAKYGWENSHLELRRTELGYEYSHVMPDANGRRYRTYFKVSEMCRLAGKPQPALMERAEQLKALLKKELWDPEIKWFRFINRHGEKDVRWTVQMYKLFEGNLLDEEIKQGLISHLNEEEFFSPYGLHSLSKKDPGYDQVDIDNGGGGICTSFPPLIAQFMYLDGKAEAADEILKRILWWGARMPYWGDSQVANEIDYRQDTPLQSDIDSGCLAQCILFGIFGINADFEGNITANPSKTGLAGRLEVKGMKIRGKSLDIKVSGNRYEVTDNGKVYSGTVGTATIIQNKKICVLK